MYKFTRLNKGQKAPSQEDIADFIAVITLCTQHRHILFDDVFCPAAQGQTAFLEAVTALIEAAERNFWVVRRKRDNAFAGFVYLYNFYGGGAKNARIGATAAGSAHVSTATLSSAYVGCCFKREFWGEEALKIGKKFIKHCFVRLSIHKLKCETMRSNPYVANFLRRLSFKLEGVMEEDTFVGGKPENLLLWGLTAVNWTKLTKKRTLGALDYTSRSINNKVIVADFLNGRKKD